ncbi:endonuclease domain-containing protein [Marilutibacter alkalisoli]|uniref:Endonuclease domain-containing protein n=1 Tax=Marilutibacter alkalisoli TaxID=2591633 RepID=A0A514BV67_9GAMM|nr:endonuclease domain-containing protein [Lysobacter alkalisoli]QDH70929.1 endonuclease domain-containing protein [Lysobacter alkalisoli]
MRQGQKRDFARRLRRSMTDAEHRLWYHLRNRALMGWKFRRQYPVGPYIADFACLEAWVLVELDGGQHADDAQDAIRDGFLQAKGYRVLRFWNNDALERTEVVLEVIHAALVSGGPHPNPSPARGRGA